jgi:chromosome segregation ATPase
MHIRIKVVAFFSIHALSIIFLCAKPAILAEEQLEFSLLMRYPMSTAVLKDAELPIAADDFNALEQRVLRTVELLKKEREARANAEQNANTLQQLLDEQSAQLTKTQEQVRTLEQEREAVRQRVERLLNQLDEISA